MKIAKISALLLALLLTVTLMGCEKIDLSGGKKPSSGTGSTGTDADPNVLTVATSVSGRETFRPDEGISPKTDRILERFREVEKETGITISVSVLSESELTNAFVRACRTGKKYADVIQADGMFLSRYYDEGYFIPIDEAGLAPSETGCLKKADGTVYALRADGWNNPNPTLSYLLFYNEKLLKDGGCETPLELYEAKAWNWTNFEKLCSQITDAYPGEVWALAYPDEGNTDLVWATLHAAGLTYFSQDGTCIMDSAEGLNGFDKLKDLLTAGVTITLGTDVNPAGEETAKMAFTNRRTAFLIGNSSLLFETGAGSLSEELGEDLRIIGFPAIQKGASGAVFTEQDLFIGITSGANTDLCKTVLPKLFAPLEEGEDLIETYFYHEKDGEIYLDLLKTADTDSSFPMTDNRSLMEEYFIQVARGGSAKEILNNFQTIFNSQPKG